eukprot:GHVU01205977.1.p2 GENE.GHVU01205977.1~~GHVU01205977.1.p2  ORF type:complete len:104 (-),score=6.16 GHVU01205977.1:101-412(-)
MFSSHNTTPPSYSFLAVGLILEAQSESQAVSQSLSHSATRSVGRPLEKLDREISMCATFEVVTFFECCRWSGSVVVDDEWMDGCVRLIGNELVSCFYGKIKYD